MTRMGNKTFLPACALLTTLIGLFSSGCGSAPEIAPSEPVLPLDRQLASFSSAHNSQNFNAVAAGFSSTASVKSPAMPRRGTPKDYMTALIAEPFRMDISQTEILFANKIGAKTRSRVKLSSPARYSLEEPLEVLWKFENGQWRIQEIDFPAWPPFVGTWKKSGQRGESSMELRLIPGGQYLVYADKDRSLPTFRGHYRFEGNTLFLTDSSAADSGNLSTEEGRYVVIISGPSASFRKVDDENRWRADRFEGTWTSAR